MGGLTVQQHAIAVNKQWLTIEETGHAITSRHTSTHFVRYSIPITDIATLPEPLDHKGSHLGQ